MSSTFTALMNKLTAVNNDATNNNQHANVHDTRADGNAPVSLSPSPPLFDSLPKSAAVSPFDLVIFGASGDLSLNKLLPALLHRHIEHHLAAGTRIITIYRSGTPEDLLEKIHSRCHTIIDNLIDTLAKQRIGSDESGIPTSQDIWKSFATIITPLQLDIADTTHQGWKELGRLLSVSFDARKSPSKQEVRSETSPRVGIFYLATGADLFGTICATLAQYKLIKESSRVVLEKPLGHDQASAKNLNFRVLKHFHEEQIYRIDHYLGKETVQNLMVLRFANTMFEAVWNRHYIDHVQICVAETLGVGNRAHYFNRYGIICDMIQNHLLQLVCLTAMEPPWRFEANAVRDEKLKILQALRPIDHNNISQQVAIGQYEKGIINDQPAQSYHEDVGESSTTESFCAMRLHIDNWRWAGVPFYIRTGKRLAMRASEIVIVFKSVPHSIFSQRTDGNSHEQIPANRLVIRLQPDEGLRLHQQVKKPGPGGVRLQTAQLNLSFGDQFSERLPDAYERLIMDVARGNQTLFMRLDEIDAAWKWIDPIRHALNEMKQSRGGIGLYHAGSWGPNEANQLIARDNRDWITPSSPPVVGEG